VVSCAIDKKDITMGKVKCSVEMNEQSVKYNPKGGKSATKVSKEPWIDTNTMCSWVREYRNAYGCCVTLLKK